MFGGSLDARYRKTGMERLVGAPPPISLSALALSSASSALAFNVRFCRAVVSTLCCRVEGSTSLYMLLCAQVEWNE
jgi:hypothetical protein